MGIGIFPGNTAQHPIFIMTTFISGDLSAIYSFKIINPPLKYLAILLGIICLFFLLTQNIFTPLMGIGGVKRWINEL